MKKGAWRALRSGAASRTSCGGGGNSLRRLGTRMAPGTVRRRRLPKREPHAVAQQPRELAARQVHDRERQQVGELAIVAVATPVLRREPALEEGRQLGIERLVQLPYAHRASASSAASSASLKYSWPRLGASRRSDGAAAGQPSRSRASRQRLFQLQRRQPVAQHLARLGLGQRPRVRHSRLVYQLRRVASAAARASCTLEG